MTGTVNVFEAAKAAGLRTTVAYASSAAVYDEDGRRSRRGRSTASSSSRTRAPRASTPTRAASRASGSGRSRSTARAATRASTAAPDAGDRGRAPRRAVPHPLRRPNAAPLRGRRRPRVRPGGAHRAERRRDLQPGRSLDRDRRLRRPGRARAARRRDHRRRDAAPVSPGAAGAVVRLAAHPARGRRPRDRRALAPRHIVASPRQEGERCNGQDPWL